jgi:hypothetical protein
MRGEIAEADSSKLRSGRDDNSIAQTTLSSRPEESLAGGPPKVMRFPLFIAAYR